MAANEFKDRFQTRSDEKSGLQFFKTFDEAYIAFERDQTIHKISFDNYRWRPKFAVGDKWSHQSENKLKRLSSAYAEGKSKLYWVDQAVMPRNFEKQWAWRYDLINDPMFGDQYYADCINEVITDEEFIKRFSETYSKISKDK